MDENANIDSADRSPFRRFPYVQLVFCIACLSMTGWTWMRHSYCWNVRVDDLIDAYSEEDLALVNLLRRGRFKGQAYQLKDQTWPREAYVRVEAVVGPCHATPEKASVWIAVDPDDVEKFIRVKIGPDTAWSEWQSALIVGRVRPEIHGSAKATVLDASGGRFTGNSVAGLVVGAMGAFIFGLYLRGWMNQRRASHVEKPEGKA